MLRLRNYEYRLYPTKKQEARLYSHFRLCTELYNRLLTLNQETYEATGKRLGWFDLNNDITELKRNEPKFKAVYARVLLDQANRLSKAFQNFFRRCKEKKEGKSVKVGYPRYKRLTHSICYP